MNKDLLRPSGTAAMCVLLAACVPTVTGPEAAETSTSSTQETNGETLSEPESGESETETETGSETESETETETETGSETESESESESGSETGDEEPELPPTLPPEGPRPPVREISVSAWHACALLEDGSISCWGSNTYGQLGLGHTQFIGGSEYVCGRVDIGGAATQISTGGHHSCALREDGELFCWGSNRWGQLGRGDLRYVGNDEAPVDAGPVELGEPVEQVWAGYQQTCARVESGALYCWGENALDAWDSYGPLGYGDPLLGNIGDDEGPTAAGPIALGGIPVDMSIGSVMCAALESGELRCWGADAPAVGADHGQVIGDDETPLAVPPVALSADVVAVAGRSCALLESGEMRCWGANQVGQLGLGHFDEVGHDVGVLDVPPIAFDEAVIAMSRSGSCAILESGASYCWGGTGSHRLGYPDIDENIGGDLLPMEAGPLQLPGPVSAIEYGTARSCALVESDVYCWGSQAYLGVVAEEEIGDDEPPASLGPMHFGYETCEGLDAGPSVLDGLADASLVFWLADPDASLPTDYGIGETLHITGNNDLPQCEECERKSFTVRNGEGELLALKIQDMSLGLLPGVLAALELDAAQWHAPVGLEQLEPGQCPASPDCEGTTQRLALEFTHPDGPPARLLDGSQGLVSGGYLATVWNLELPSPDSCDAIWNEKIVSLVRQDCAPDCGPVAWIDTCEEELDELDRLFLNFNSESEEPSEYIYDISCEIIDITQDSWWYVELDCAGIP